MFLCVREIPILHTALSNLFSTMHIFCMFLTPSGRPLILVHTLFFCHSPSLSVSSFFHPTHAPYPSLSLSLSPPFYSQPDYVLYFSLFRSGHLPPIPFPLYIMLPAFHHLSLGFGLTPTLSHYVPPFCLCAFQTHSLSAVYCTLSSISSSILRTN